MIERTYVFKKDGKVNEVYTLRNGIGEVDILTYGGRITRIWMPDRNGEYADLVVGCAKAEDYYDENPYFGATIGRFGNRIGGAMFTLNGQVYHLENNEGQNVLHGGKTASFDRMLWSAKIEGDILVLSHISEDGAGGFPGKMQVEVRFTLTKENELVIEYLATSDKDTVCNLTNHTYFNVGGQETVLGHELMIKSKKITPVDEQLIPRGAFMDIDGTPYSFYPAKLLGKDMFSEAPLIKQCNGYDFNYCLDRDTVRDLEHFAYVYDKETGRRMDCYTTLPGVQLYTACGTGGFQGKKTYVNHCALCLETQGYPNSPNCREYPSTFLKAGALYNEKTVYRFSVK